MRKKPLFSNSVAHLKDITPFGEGASRRCYVHPDNPALCIKVQKPEVLRTKSLPVRLMSPIYYRTENISDATAYRQKAVRNGSVRLWEHIPRLHGWQKTDLGWGLVSDYYSTDGHPAPTLRALLRAHGITREINEAVKELARFLLETHVITRNIHPHNVVLAQDGRLKIVDDLGNRGMSLYGATRATARFRIRRNLYNLYQQIAWETGGRNPLWDDWKRDNMGAWMPDFVCRFPDGRG